MISVSEAKQILSSHIQLTAVEKVDIESSLNCILADNVIASVDVPSFHNTAMDGYAIIWDEQQSSFQLKQKIQAGEHHLIPIQKGEAARIFTGAPMPPGADTVIQQELVTVENEYISFDYKLLKQGANVRYQGSQNKAGDIIAKQGSMITPGMIGLFASVGVQSVPIYHIPSVALIITGNELQAPGTILKPGSIYNSNEPMLKSYLRKTGIQDIQSFHANDTKEALLKVVQQALITHDILIFTGGISVGEYDFVQEVLNEVGVDALFYKVKQKPGKPLYIGKKQKQWVFALPGNPASVISCYNQFVQPVIKASVGHQHVFNCDMKFPALNNYHKKPGLTHFLKAKLSHDGVEILPGQDSFNMIAYNEANAIVEIEEHLESLHIGELVKVYQL